MNIQFLDKGEPITAIEKHDLETEVQRLIDNPPSPLIRANLGYEITYAFADAEGYADVSKPCEPAQMVLKRTWNIFMPSSSGADYICERA